VLQPSLLMRYKAEATLRFNEDRYLYGEGKVTSNRIEFEPLPQELGKGFRVTLEVEARNKNEAREKALSLLETFAVMLCCKTNIGADIESVKVTQLPTVHQTERGIEISVPVQIEVDVGVTLSLKLDRELLKSIENLTSGLNRLSLNKRELIMRTLKWYNHGMIERDPIDRFICFWIALEAWSKWVAPEESRSKRKMRFVLEKYNYEGDTEELYEVRSALFHAGVEEKIKDYLPKLETCAFRVIQHIREILTS
jgi:hypothetical protein